ncbi:MAG: response regulator transcription factor [Anaerolineales bacterium]|nr:response regulator transcription factor [Anaerolineales bacterium]
MIKVLLADDHHLFREGLSRLLQDAPGIEWVGCATNGEEAVELTARHNPEVVLMDVNMPGMGGLEACRQIRTSHPQAAILMLTISEQSEDLFEAIRLGARGYLLKNASTQELLEAIRQVNAGEAPITPAMAVKLMDEFAVLSSGGPSQPELDARTENLTDRELDVLRLVAQGLSNKEIGAALSISPLTVKSHLRSILDKLHLRGRVEAAAWAIRHGLLRGD